MWPAHAPRSCERRRTTRRTQSTAKRSIDRQWVGRHPRSVMHSSPLDVLVQQSSRRASASLLRYTYSMPTPTPLCGDPRSVPQDNHVSHIPPPLSAVLPLARWEWGGGRKYPQATARKRIWHGGSGEGRHHLTSCFLLSTKKEKEHNNNNNKQKTRQQNIPQTQSLPPVLLSYSRLHPSLLLPSPPPSPGPSPFPLSSLLPHPPHVRSRQKRSCPTCPWHKETQGSPPPPSLPLP